MARPLVFEPLEKRLLLSAGWPVEADASQIASNELPVGAEESSSGDPPGRLGGMADMTLGESTLIEIGGNEPSDYTQINETEDVVLNGTLDIDLVNDFVPEINQTFDIITAGNGFSGKFDDLSGLYGYGDGSSYFKIGIFDNEATTGDPDDQIMRLSVVEAPEFFTNTPAIHEILGQFYNFDYINSISTGSIDGEVTVDEFVNIQGTFNFSVSSVENATVATGLTSGPATLENVDMYALSIGATNVHAFVGVNGPYWVDDLDDDGNIGWVLPTGGTFHDNVTIGITTYITGQSTTGVTLTDLDQIVTVDNVVRGDATFEGVQYGDLDEDDLVDANETAELNEDALGLVVNDLDIGFTLMKPDPADADQGAEDLNDAHPFAAFWALKATAEEFAFVGWDDVELSAQSITINVNSGLAWPSGLGVPVIDFAASFPAETTDDDGDGKIDPVGFEVVADDDPITPVSIYVDFDGNRRVGFSSERITVRLSEFIHVTGSFAFEKGPKANVDIATGVPSDALDALEILGNEIMPAEGGDVGLGTAIRNVGAVIPETTVSTFQVGASDVHAFVGLNGPYWTADLDGDGSIGWVLPTGGTFHDNITIDGTPYITGQSTTGVTLTDPNQIITVDGVVRGDATIDGVQYGDLDEDDLIDANETAELNADAIGLMVNDLDIGLVMMEPKIASLASKLGLRTDKLRGILPKFTALKATAEEFAFVGWDEIELSAKAIEINYNNGTEWFGLLGPPVVDFSTSFETAPGEADGVFEVQTGGDPVYIDFDGNQRIGFSSECITLRLSEFIHVTGSFAFEKGPVTNVDVATGLPSSMVNAVADLIYDFTGSETARDNFQTYAEVIPGIEVSTFQIGASNVHTFVGLNGPYWTEDLDNDGGISWVLPVGGTFHDNVTINGTSYTEGETIMEVIAWTNGDPIVTVDNVVRGDATFDGVQYGDADGDGIVDADETVELNENAIGLATENVDIGMVMMEPTIGSFAELLGVSENNIKGIIPKFTALKATADSVRLVGFDEEELELSAQGITINYNNGTEWFGLFGPPVVDFSTSFETAPGEANGVYEVQTGGDPVYIDFDGNQRIGAEVDHVTLQISEFVHVTGGLAFEKGPVQTVETTGGLLSGSGGSVADLLSEYGFDLPADVFPASGETTTEVSALTIGASNVHAFVGIDGPYWTDSNHNDQVDPGETSDDAKGLWINDFDFGMALLKPTNPFDFTKYTSLKATAEQIALVGIDNVTAEINELLVEINLSSPSWYGLPLFPVIDYANTPQFTDERLTLFDTDDNGSITVGELRVLHGEAADSATSFTGLYTNTNAATDLVDIELIVDVLDVDVNKVLTVEEAEALALLSVGTAAEDADSDGDGKLDPLGFEIGTGGEPVYLDMDSSLIRAQGFLDLDILQSLVLRGSVAFELGPEQDVTLSNGSSKTVTTMTIGAANVTAFVGYAGPYWVEDSNGNHQMDVGEENTDAVGLHITDLDLGLMVMASTNPADLGVYLAGKASVDSFGFVGLDQVQAEGTFDIALNVGVGMASGAAVVDFRTTFDEDLNDDGDSLDADEWDKNGDGDVDQGFEVNTGDPSSPVVLDFGQSLIRFQLGGNVTVSSDTTGLNPVFKLSGLALFDADAAAGEISLFVAAGLEFGPDIDSNDKFFDMNALGGLVINEQGIAADIDVSAAIGGALSSSMSVGASLDARLIFNTTENNQDITIPAKYVQFLGDENVPNDVFSEPLDPEVDALRGELDDRFTTHNGDPNYEDGSATFTISGTAPTLAALFPNAELEDNLTHLSDDSAYFAVAIEAALVLNDDWSLDGRFGLVVSDTGFVMSAEANLNLGPVEAYVRAFISLIKFDDPGTVGDDRGLIVDTTVSLNCDLYSFLYVNLEGALQINTTEVEATQDESTIAPDSFYMHLEGEMDLLSVLTFEGNATFDMTGSEFIITVDMSVNFFGIGYLKADGIINSEGEYDINVIGGVRLGIPGYGLSGSGELHISYMDQNGMELDGLGDPALLVSGSLDVKVELFHVTLVGAELDIAYSSATSQISVLASVKILWWTKKYRFYIGRMAEPEPSYLAGNVDDTVSTAFNGGALYLNIGDRRLLRHNTVSPDEIDESLTVEYLRPTEGGNGHDIRVRGFGTWEDYSGVTEIIADGGDGIDFIEIMPDVSVPVTLQGGEDDDYLKIGDLTQCYLLDGGEGEDVISIVGDDSAQDLRISIDASNAVSIASYEDSDVLLNSVTLLNVETVSLSGGNGADSFSISGELNLGGVTDVVIDMGETSEETEEPRDNDLDEISLTLGDNDDEFLFAPFDTGLQGIWKDHFTFNVLSGNASDGDKIDVDAGGGDNEIAVYFDPANYTSVSTGPDPNNPDEFYLEKGDVKFGLTYSFEQNDSFNLFDALVVDVVDDVMDGITTQGDLSLREAIGLANGSSTYDAIFFDPKLANETIEMTDAAFTISDNLMMIGPSVKPLTISGMETRRIFLVDDGIAETTLLVNIMEMTMIKGKGDNSVYGGAIYNNEDLTIEECVFMGNQAGYGGAVGSEGPKLTVVNSTVYGNWGYGHGGGIYSLDELYVYDSEIDGNKADDNNNNFGDGGGVYCNGLLTMENTRVIDNITLVHGGGIYLAADGEGDVRNSTISGNKAEGDGGGIYTQGPLHLVESTVAMNQSDSNNNNYGSGGGIYNNNILTVERATITGNISLVHGGGIYIATDGEGDIRNSTISNNEADGSGGGIYSESKITLVDVGFEANRTGDDGGAVVSFYTPTVPDDIPTITNCVFSNNDAYDKGAAVLNLGDLAVSSSTFASNRGYWGGGIYSGISTGLTVENCLFDSNEVVYDGGAILSVSRMTISNSTFINNNAYDDGGAIVITYSTSEPENIPIIENCDFIGNEANDKGGAVLNNQGTVDLLYCTFEGGKSNHGAGIYTTDNSQTVVKNCIFNGNAAIYDGGAITNHSSLTLIGSLIDGNLADRNGGGISNEDGVATINNSTISNNSSAVSGGGICNWDGSTLTVTNSTIVYNIANDKNIPGNGAGGGIRTPSGSTTKLHNTIIAHNLHRTDASQYDEDLHGTVHSSSSFNLLMQAGGSMPAGNDNIIGEDPQLMSLNDYGGATQLFALQQTSPAINNGSITIASDLTTDQRGAPFLRNDGGGVDIGAYEAQSLFIYIDAMEDVNNGIYTAGDLALHEAIELTNNNPGGDKIGFDDDLEGSLLTLKLGELAINDDVEIFGRGVTLDAEESSRVVMVHAGATVVIRDLTIQGGYADYGGGVRVDGELSLFNSVIANNVAIKEGGGIYNESGVLKVATSTISNNSAEDHYGGGICNRAELHVANSMITNNYALYHGGGIANISGVASVDNSVLTTNSAGYSGGGIVNWMDGELTVTNSTIVDNRADDNIDSGGTGGGVRTSSQGTNITTLHNTIVARNTNGDENDDYADDLSGSVQTGSSHNLVGYEGTGGLVNGVNGNLIGTTIVAPIDPLFIDPAGGDYRLHAGSPAVDEGDHTLLPLDVHDLDDDGNIAERIPYDIDGRNRVVGDDVDIGAHEYAVTALLEGTAGDDTIRVWPGTPGLADHRFQINGVDSYYDASVYGGFQIDGLGGIDTLNVYGKATSENAEFDGTSVLVSERSAYDTIGQNFENIFVFSGGGADTAQMLGSAGNDNLYLNESYSYLRGNGNSFLNYVSAFDSVSANVSGSGGTDTTYAYDGINDDVVVAGETQATIDFNTTASPGVNVMAQGFSRVDVYGGNGGIDTATLNGSAGNDALTGRETYSYVTGNGGAFVNFVKDFANVIADVSTSGGADTAVLVDSNGDDRLDASQASVVLDFNASGPSDPNITATGFPSVSVYAMKGGDDEVYFTGSAGDDRFYGRDTYGKMKWNSAASYAYASGFDYVEADLTGSGGTDLAALYDSPGDDTLIAGDAQASLDYYAVPGPADPDMVAIDFDQTYTYATKGGNDQATLNGSVGNDRFTSKTTYGIMKGPTGTFFNYATGFDHVIGDATVGGGTDKAYMYDSTANDLLTADPTTVTLDYDPVVSPGVDVTASGFDETYTYSQNGGVDMAVMNGSAGTDRFYGLETRSYLRASDNSYYNYVTGFNAVNANAIGTGDIAFLYDSNGDDVLNANSTSAAFTLNPTAGTPVVNTASAFDQVYTYALNGGTDQAYLTGTTGDDTLTGDEDWGFMRSTGSSDYFNYVKYFDEVFADPGDDNIGNDLLDDRGVAYTLDSDPINGHEW